MYETHNMHQTFERNLLPVKEADLGLDFGKSSSALLMAGVSAMTWGIKLNSYR